MQTVKSGSLLVQIKETLVQLITEADLLCTEVKMLRVCLLHTSEALKKMFLPDSPEYVTCAWAYQPE